MLEAPFITVGISVTNSLFFEAQNFSIFCTVTHSPTPSCYIVLCDFAISFSSSHCFYTATFSNIICFIFLS